jgi:ectoine hydroxylase-related dioxygenase (phytanoyl-CoA dioxygenase family)
LDTFDRQGFFLIPSIIPQKDLQVIQNVVDEAIQAKLGGKGVHGDSKVDWESEELDTLNTGGRLFFFLLEDTRPEINRLLFSDYVFSIVKSMLGDNAYYTHSEIVVKLGNQTPGTTQFGWHQDSGYIPYQHTPYLSLWCALDEMTTKNGTVAMLPFDRMPVDGVWSAFPRPGGKRMVPYIQHSAVGNTAEKIGYFDKDPGDLIVCPVGSITVFSSLTFHASSDNTTSAPRRAINIQFSPVPLMMEDGKSLRHKAIPFIINGQITQEALALRGY